MGMEDDDVTAEYDLNDKGMEEFKIKYFFLLEKKDEIFKSSNVAHNCIETKVAVKDEEVKVHQRMSETLSK